MAEFTAYAQGTPSWVDLATIDPEGAKRFYQRLFGWSYRTESGDWGSYTMCLLRDKTVAGLFEQPQGERDLGIPPHWLTYLSVDSVDESAARASQSGGVVVVPPMDVLDSGRMATVQDPAGAFVSFWEARSHIGAELANEPGTVSWNELQVHDTEAAKTFYESVLGISSHTSDTASGAPYTTFLVGGRSVAGMMEISKSWGPVPPHWDVYFAVEDTDTTLEVAVAAGGRVDVPAMDIPAVGRFAGVTDPQGAMFFILATV
jgi:predicted enzyme related to lactoylglutathione lyase